jgi:hypothetical protein
MCVYVCMCASKSVPYHHDRRRVPASTQVAAAMQQESRTALFEQVRIQMALTNGM